MLAGVLAGLDWVDQQHCSSSSYALAQHRQASALCSAHTLGWLRLLPFTGSAIGKLSEEQKKNRSAESVRQ